MTIHGIRIVSSASEFIEDYTKRLKKQGARIIGEGLYATVYQHPTHPNVVVKVFEPKYGKNYLGYVRACQTSFKNNPWVPKFYGKVETRTVRDREGNDRKVCFVFMEKLAPSTKEACELLVRVLNGTDKKHENPKLKSVESIFQGWAKWYRWKPRFSTGSSVLVDRLWWKIVSETVASSFDDTLRKLVPIAEFFSQDTNLDIDIENIMMRGAQWVFTDPVHEDTR